MLTTILVIIGIWLLVAWAVPSQAVQSLTRAIREIEDAKNNNKPLKTTPYEDNQAKWKAEDEWDKKHPIIASIKDFYYTTRRFLYEIPELPRYGFRKIKRGIQRAYRGWADEDTWNFDHYLSKIIKGGVTRLNNLDRCLKTSNTDDEDKNWDITESKKIFEDIIYAFKINEQICNGEREAYYPNLKKSMKDKFDSNFLTRDEERRRIRGMKLFIKYYFSLWD
jgi:hypothetical protein